MGKLWDLLPGNESTQLSIERKTLWVPRMPRRLSGIQITHLSDLHFTGRVSREFFERVVDEANRLESDVIAITGDIIDRAECLSWVAPVLGRLQAKHGVFFILGNHDARPGEKAVRTALVEAGLISLGGESVMIEHDGFQLLLAGDERPWFGEAPPLDGRSEADVRVLLSHTPDQYAWARQQGFDIVLAGHTHGGQVKLPLIGPVISPSLHGARYADGVFDESPTVMHVSRGLSGLQPFRFGCPPELTRLTLAADLSALVEEEAAPQRQRQGSTPMIPSLTLPPPSGSPIEM